jgi:hypothetical protein
MQGLRSLLVKPDQAHLGGQLYLSGSGFEPHVREYLTVACPDVERAFTIKNGSIEQIPGPVTDSQGNFSKFPFRLFSPIPQVTSPLVCTVYASYGNNFLGVDIPGQYTVVPVTESLTPCSVHMCNVTVQPVPLRVHAGLIDVITVSGGWGGALAEVKVLYVGLKIADQPAVQRQQLDWEGRARFKFYAPAHMDRAMVSVAARVSVRVRLGSVAGVSSGTFTVIR